MLLKIHAEVQQTKSFGVIINRDRQNVSVWHGAIMFVIVAWGYCKLNGGSYFKEMCFDFLGNVAIISEDLIVMRSPDCWCSCRESMFANIALVL